MAQKISVINWKGGVGKTTFSYHIATGLKEMERDDKQSPRILLIDLDPQCNLSISCLDDDYFEDIVYKANHSTVKNLLEKFFVLDNPDINTDDFIFKNSVRRNIDRNGNVIHYKYLDLIVSHQDLIYTDMDIAALLKISSQGDVSSKDVDKFKLLHNFINLIEDSYDYIIIDCPPNLNIVTQNALYASDYYLIPTLLDKLSTYGILSITNKVQDLNEMFSELSISYTNTKLAGIVANKVVINKGAPKITQHNFYRGLEKTFGDALFKNYITSGDGISEASSKGLPVYSISGSNAAKQAESFKIVVNEMLQRIYDSCSQGLDNELFWNDINLKNNEVH